MAVSFYALLEACLLVLNGIAVLNKERFLKKVFCAFHSLAYFSIIVQFHIAPTTLSNSFESPDPSSMKMQLFNLVIAVQTVMRGNTNLF
ncbi:unnamed protein product [Toxocara canis]|uniref:Immediate early response 3-interacting protein 1 n=1 Tax=Toxocara canis TaxID=6265 RepID=A0A183TXB5_TOXCA|nr:unnamed protein product [Toxocara canis]